MPSATAGSKMYGHTATAPGHTGMTYSVSPDEQQQAAQPTQNVGNPFTYGSTPALPASNPGGLEGQVQAGRAVGAAGSGGMYQDPWGGWHVASPSMAGRIAQGSHHALMVYGSDGVLYPVGEQNGTNGAPGRRWPRPADPVAAAAYDRAIQLSPGSFGTGAMQPAWSANVMDPQAAAANGAPAQMVHALTATPEQHAAEYQAALSNPNASPAAKAWLAAHPQQWLGQPPVANGGNGSPVVGAPPTQPPVAGTPPNPTPTDNFKVGGTPMPPVSQPPAPPVASNPPAPPVSQPPASKNPGPIFEAPHAAAASPVASTGTGFATGSAVPDVTIRPNSGAAGQVGSGAVGGAGSTAQTGGVTIRPRSSRPIFGDGMGTTGVAPYGSQIKRPQPQGGPTTTVGLDNPNSVRSPFQLSGKSIF